MRLIDADALKKHFPNDTDWNYPVNTNEYVCECIDNASTVEPFEPDYVGAERLKARQRGYEEGYHNGFEIGKTLNPKIKQGEWGKWVISEIQCPNCLAYFDTDCYSTGELNKCPNCGAKMKGGAE